MTALLPNVVLSYTHPACKYSHISWHSNCYFTLSVLKYKTQKPVLGVLDEPYSAKPNQRSRPSAGLHRMDTVAAYVDWRVAGLYGTATPQSGVN